MSVFDEYSKKFEHVTMSRENGILLVRLHSDGQSLKWGFKPHYELGRAFRAIAHDQDNLVMILTGTGSEFCGPRASEGDDKGLHTMRSTEWDQIHADGMELIDSLLSIQAIVIAAVNGPAVRHCELALLSDIVIASESAEFQDSAHFPNNLTPGDGMNVITAMTMGITRARYFHLTGQSINAYKALDLGMVNEVVPEGELQARAYALARQLVKQSPGVIRHSRLLFTHEIRRKMLDLVGYGIALEGMDVADAHYEKTLRNMTADSRPEL